MTPSARILVVEDDLHIRQLHYMVLGGAGYRVDLAEDGQAGWEALRKNHYDLVLTDNSMPRLKGYELTQKMRAAGLMIPVILVTSCLSSADEKEFQGVGLAGRLLKPFRLEDLLGMVKSVLASRDNPSDFSRMWHAA